MVLSIRVHLEARRTSRRGLPGLRTNCAPGRHFSCGAISWASDPALSHRRRHAVRLLRGERRVACHLALGWPLPAKVLDLSPEFRCITNGLKTPEGKGLARRAGLLRSRYDQRQAWKDAMRKRIMQGWPFSAEEREQILKYCASDIDALVPSTAETASPHRSGHRSLSRRIRCCRCRHGASRRADGHGAYFRGCKTSTPGRRFVRDAMVPAIDAKYGVYVKRQGRRLVVQRRAVQGISRAQPASIGRRLETGKLNLQRKTFEAMAKRFSATRGSAAAALRARQDATHKAGGRRRRAQSHRAVAVQGKNIAHATEGLAVDFLAGGVAALADQARTRRWPSPISTTARWNF